MVTMMATIAQRAQGGPGGNPGGDHGGWVAAEAAGWIT